MEELGLRRLQLTKLMKEHSHVLGLSVDNKLRINVRASQYLWCNGGRDVFMHVRTPPADPRHTLFDFTSRWNARADAEGSSVAGVQLLYRIVLMPQKHFPQLYVPRCICYSIDSPCAIRCAERGANMC